MAVYYKRKTMGAGASNNFQVSLVKSHVTLIAFFAKSPSFTLRMDPLLKQFADSLVLQIDTGLILPVDFNWGGGDIDITIVETGGVANEYTLIVSSDPTSTFAARGGL